MNLQVISAPDGEVQWVSGALPGSVHDLNTARIWGVLRAPAASPKPSMSSRPANSADEKRSLYAREGTSARPGISSRDDIPKGEISTT